MANGNIVGRVSNQKYEWFILSDNTAISFHTAYLNKERTIQVTFYSDSDTFASVQAQKLGIKAHFIRNATEDEINRYLVESELVIKDKIRI